MQQGRLREGAELVRGGATGLPVSSDFSCPSHATEDRRTQLRQVAEPGTAGPPPWGEKGKAGEARNAPEGGGASAAPCPSPWPGFTAHGPGWGQFRILSWITWQMCLGRRWSSCASMKSLETVSRGAIIRGKPTASPPLACIYPGPPLSSYLLEHSGTSCPDSHSTFSLPR